LSDRNAYGAICIETHGNASVPTAFTQLHHNGEIWGVSREFIGHQDNVPTVLMTNFENALRLVLPNYIAIASQLLGSQLSYTVEIGAVGLSHVLLTLPRGSSRFNPQVSGPVYEPSVKFEDDLTVGDEEEQERLITAFIRKLYDLVGVAI
jgi:hypothetical protein